MVNWEEIFQSHIEKTRRLENVREENNEKEDKKEKSLELLRDCTSFLKENEKSWITEAGGPKLKKKKENKNRKLELARRQKEET